MTDLDKQHDEIFRKAQASQNQNTESRDEGIHATANAPQQIVNQSDGPGRGILLTLAIAGLVFGSIGFLAGGSALFFAVSAISDASRAVAKAETATSRAQVSEIYSKQLFTEMNRIGYPIRTPAEEHAPQPDSGLSPQPEATK